MNQRPDQWSGEQWGGQQFPPAAPPPLPGQAPGYPSPSYPPAQGAPGYPAPQGQPGYPPQPGYQQAAVPGGWGQPGQGSYQGQAYADPGAMPSPSPMPNPSPLPDPGRLEDPAALQVTEKTRTYPCRACGGQLIFDAKTQGMRCPSCGNTQAVTPAPPGATVGKRDLAETMITLYARLEQAPQGSIEKEIVCQSCGGHTTFSGTLTAVRCPYCNTPIQRDDLQNAPVRLPVDGVLPLRVDDQTARKQIEGWISSRWFAPTEFKKYRELGSFTSIYLTYFTYDAETWTAYSGMRGENYTVMVGEGDNRHAETRTNWYPASGQVQNVFVDVPAMANNGLDTPKVAALEPWPTQLAVPYSQEYVAGHLARTYDIDGNQAFEAFAQPKINSEIESTIRADIGGDQQQIHSRDTRYNYLHFAQLLLPVWLLTVTYGGKPFQVFINGVTGEVQGRRPYSAIKITIAIIIGVIVIGLLFWLFRRNG